MYAWGRLHELPTSFFLSLFHSGALTPFRALPERSGVPRECLLLASMKNLFLGPPTDRPTPVTVLVSKRPLYPRVHIVSTIHQARTYLHVVPTGDSTAHRAKLLGSDRPRVKARHRHLLTLWHWVSCLTFLSLVSHVNNSIYSEPKRFLYYFWNTYTQFTKWLSSINIVHSNKPFM